MPNRLINEKSPYLLRNAHSPVDWYPWGEEAFRRAKEEDKPILLSIGYSACYWCSVMENETYNNREVAELINENFIPIKVDREELPEVDEIYMKAVQYITGQTGWPLTVFLTPDLKPFFGGTYFPPYRSGQLPGLVEILKVIVDAWKNNRKTMIEASEGVMELLKKAYSHKATADMLSKNVIEEAYEQLVSMYDEGYGGFSFYPKFPMPTFLFFLHRFYWRYRKDFAIKISLNTLSSMALGGIHDQLAGGFHRYSTDRYWTIPHFEKMLYDNALLARAYIEAYLLTKDEFMKKVAVKTLDWMLSELSSPEGGFYTSIAAGHEYDEGSYYLWSMDEIIRLLGEKAGKIVCKYYGVTQRGNYGGGRNVLCVRRSAKSIASEFNLSVEEVENIIEDSNKILLSERRKRKMPEVDDKILTSWNSLAISAMCMGFQALGDEKYLKSAVSATKFIIKNMYKDGVLLRRYRDSDAAYVGTLEDYAFFMNSLLDLFETTFDPNWLELALELKDELVKRFYDKEYGGFFKTEAKISDLNLKDSKDGSIPSGNSFAIMNLIRLSEIVYDPELLEIAKKSFLAFWDNIKQNPVEYTYMLTALDYYMSPRREFVFVCDNNDCTQFLRILWSEFIPDKVVVVCNSENRERLERLTPIAKDKRAVDGKVSVYICENYACRLPITSLDEFYKYLKDQR
ncbi:MAG: thioredoxin domain-containing protein [Aigarchaeota archaeon]|nr:thioredoxin domain-containing protein [Aigarchaeota archaeon]